MFASCQVIDQKCMTKITSEFSRLKGRCYLDSAGAALYPQSLLQYINEDLLNNVYMNPHTDKYTKDCIDQIRTLTLKHFNTDSSEYTVIFTSGTTQSLKLVVESFQFNCDENGTLNCGSFMYLQDNHTSVLGLREIAEDKNADIIHISHENFLELLDSRKKPLLHSWKERKKDEGNSLLVYPAQSNFNGYKYPINIIENIKNGCLNNYVRKHLCKVNRNWYVLLDAASFIATNKLDLSITKPDFVCFSFYKIFGYPTGLGALLVKKSSEHVLCQKRYFGGGTVDMVLSSEDFHVKRKSLSERFEDGTVPFLSIVALKHSFDTINRLVPKVVKSDLMDTISHHTFNLAKDLYYQLKGLKHPNGRNAVALYMDTDFSDIRVQGGIVNFNVLREDGSYVGYAEFQHMADLFEINIRTGCFCNSGSCQRHLKTSNKEMKNMYKAGHICGDELDLVNGRPTGAVRASFGYYNTFQDVDRLVSTICKCYVRTKLSKPNRIMNQVYNHLEATTAHANHTFVVDKMKKLCESDYMSSNSIPYTTLETNIALKEISIFPIKSCSAFKVKSTWKIGPKGFEYDREWMIVNDSGVCLTQKHNSRMCMIQPKIDLNNRLLKLDFKGRNSISVPLEPLSHLNNNNFSFCQSKVCTDSVNGIDCGDGVADWISEALETSYLRLVRQSRDDSRVLNKKGETDRKLLSLSNQAQFLLINKATVRWLSDHIRDSSFDKDIDQLTDRFRANLVIDMDQELVENEWQRLIIGKHEFKVEGQCRRCQMVCINQSTGEKTIEPLRTISEKFAGKIRFGIYLSYVGAIDGSKERALTVNSPVQPLVDDDDISRSKFNFQGSLNFYWRMEMIVNPQINYITTSGNLTDAAYSPVWNCNKPSRVQQLVNYILLLILKKLNQNPQSLDQTLNLHFLKKMKYEWTVCRTYV